MGENDTIVPTTWWQRQRSNILLITVISANVVGWGTKLIEPAKAALFDWRVDNLAQNLGSMLKNDPVALEVPLGIQPESSTALKEKTIFQGEIDQTANTIEGIRIKDLLRENPDVENFIIFNGQDNLRIPRQNLEFSLAATELAAMRSGISDPLEVLLDGRSSVNASVIQSMDSKTGQLRQMPLVINAGLLASAPFNQRDLVSIIFHEVAGHATEYREGLTFKETLQKEVRADSLGFSTSQDYAGGAKEHLRFFLEYEDALDSITHPHARDRIKMAFRMFAWDNTLPQERREFQYKEFQEINRLWNAKAEPKFDFMQYYHDEFAKANPQLGKHQQRLNDKPPSPLGRNY